MTHAADSSPSSLDPNVLVNRSAAFVIYTIALYAGSFALARLCRVIGTALCGVGHGGGGPLGEKLIITSICLYIIAFIGSIATIASAWRLTKKWLPVIALSCAILFSILAELRDVAHMF